MKSEVIHPQWDTYNFDLADKIALYLSDENRYEKELIDLEKYCAFALYDERGIALHKHGVLFKLPKKLDFLTQRFHNRLNLINQMYNELAESFLYHKHTTNLKLNTFLKAYSDKFSLKIVKSNFDSLFVK